MPDAPARLHVLLAARARVGVVIRRGPAREVATLLWDRARDTFRLGQWLKGRIYELRCDLSPDGKHLLYFAMNGHWDSETRGAWTAISGAPYLKALSLFPKGDCWQGGGLWTSANTFWLNGHHDVLRQTPRVRRDTRFEPELSPGGECRSVYVPRLLRDGWELVNAPPKPRLAPELVFEKPVLNGWTLRKVTHAGAPAGKTVHWDEHALVHAASKRRLARPDWEWADLDGDRLVWAAGGEIRAAALDTEGVRDERVLFDFTPMQFERVVAPY